MDAICFVARDDLLRFALVKFSLLFDVFSFHVVLCYCAVHH